MTTTSAPHAAASPALRSSAPSAIFAFFSSGWPGKAKSGAWTESAMPFSRRDLAEALRPRVVHPEAALEVELAGRVPALEQDLDRGLGRLPGRAARRAEADRSHALTVTDSGMSSDEGPNLFDMKAPTRIDLLELDIDLRLTDLWREAGEVAEWNLEVVSAFMRAAYGKGYCDALTEDDPGSLCHDHGYRIPARREAAPRTV